MIKKFLKDAVKMASKAKIYTRKLILNIFLII